MHRCKATQPRFHMAQGSVSMRMAGTLSKGMQSVTSSAQATSQVLMSRS